jgi:hypothetical protein
VQRTYPGREVLGHRRGQVRVSRGDLPDLLGESAQLRDDRELLAVLPGRLAQLPDLPRGHQRLGLASRARRGGGWRR